MKRWWGIRHLRYWYHRRKAKEWAKMWGEAGIGIGIVNPSDMRLLDDIWKGRH